MPELPEVETVRRQLEKELVGAQIKMIEVREEKIFIGNPGEIEGQIITEFKRVGKYIFVFFKSKKGLVIHLKMTGRLVLEDSWYREAIHTRIVMTMSDGRKIYYWDTRKFGYLKLMQNISNEHTLLKNKLGPEPWDITDKDLANKLKRTTRPIKEVILDQAILTGIGNIYANDGLWLARILPTRKANTLKMREVKKLRESLSEVLKRGLAVGGASDNTYRDFYGGRGAYQDEFLTYGRTGKPCLNCGKEIKRIVVGGRGTWVCEKCQL